MSTANNLRNSVQDLLHNFVASQQADGEHIAIDILRVLQEESHLLYETQSVRDLFDQDPFECYQNNPKIQRVIERFQQCLRVTSCFRLEHPDNSCYYEAVVNCGSLNSNPRTATSPQSKKPKTTTQISQLHFQYERTPATETTATSIWYSIQFSQNHGPKEMLVNIRVWADGNRPSKLPAADMDENEEGWEDVMSEDEDQEVDKTNGKSGTKLNPKESKKPKSSKNKDEEEEQEEIDESKEETQDRYCCFVDENILLKFQEATQLTVLDQSQAFFTLMTFPYYQHEWDLVGFVLDSVFGYNDDDEGDEKEE